MYLIVDDSEKVICNPTTNKKVYKKKQYALTAYKKMNLDPTRYKIVHVSDLESIKRGKTFFGVESNIHIPEVIDLDEE